MNAVAGLVLAAGAGRRYGGPKALARAADGEPWLARATGLLQAAGCTPVLVVLGAEADAARGLVPPSAEVVVAVGWERGLGASLAAGLRALPSADAVLVTLVDLPGLPQAVVDRVLAAEPTTPFTLRRATFAGRPGHPVLIGRTHWAPMAASLAGDAGGRAYLKAHGVHPVECGDLADGRDVDVAAGGARRR